MQTIHFQYFIFLIFYSVTFAFENSLTREIEKTSFLFLLSVKGKHRHKVINRTFKIMDTGTWKPLNPRISSHSWCNVNTEHIPGFIAFDSVSLKWDQSKQTNNK